MNIILIIGIVAIMCFVFWKIAKNNNSLDSQIAWIFKMYTQEKRLKENQSKNEAELLQITAKRFLTTYPNSPYVDEIFSEHAPARGIKELANDLIS